MPFLAAALGLSTGGIALIIAAAAALAAYSPEIIKGLSGNDSNQLLSLDELMEKLRTTIEGLKEPTELVGYRGIQLEKNRVRDLEDAEAQLKSAEALKKAIESQQRQAQEAAIQFQNFIAAIAELTPCLRDICARLDQLAPVPSSGANWSRCSLKTRGRC